MNNTIKNALGIAGVLLMSVAVIALLGITKSVKKSVDQQTPSFSVSGEGEVVAVPDVAEFSFSVITEGDDDLAELQEENTEKVNSAIEYVKENGVEDKDIKTSSYNVNPRYTYFPCVRQSNGDSCPPPEISGYSISQNVSIKVRDLDNTGTLLGGVVENGANSVSQLRFTIDDPEGLKAEAREKAFERAKEKAKSLADAGDFKLGRLLSVNESSSGVPMPYPMYDRGVGFGGATEQASAPDVEPGSQDVKVTVTLQYEIKQ
ncbi:MAG: SIMPL domain-containing protein [Candidatus Spechtbacterales bacterium]|nr:SIMPL domain-containing protein [Candidatus Spechtbacterales bacterium]